MDRQPEKPERPECPEIPDYPDYPEKPGRRALPNKKCQHTKKMPGPSVFTTRGARASKGGGDLLSRIALQYHRRWRA